MTARQLRDTTPRCNACGWTGKTTTARLAAFALRRHNCDLHRRRQAGMQRRLDRLNTPGPTRDCHHPASHVHGTYAAYVLDRCRCMPCKQAHRAYIADITRRKAYGTYQQKWADAEPVRAHIQALTEAGIGHKRLVQLSGVSHGAITKLLYGWRGHEPSKRVLRTTAEAILAVKPSLETLADGALTDPTGSSRRLQALVALGWSQAKLAARLGFLPANFTALIHARRQVTVGTAKRVRALYAELSMRLPPEQTHRDRIAASRARNYAKARGWLPPLALDDDRLDDPAYDPLRHHGDDSSTPDEQAIWRRIHGDKTVPLTKQERVELVARCRADGWSLNAITERTGIANPDRYLRDTEGGAA